MFTENVFADKTINSVVAIITMNDTGENQIIVISGVTSDINYHPDLDRYSHLLLGPKVLVLQLEIPIYPVVAAARTARKEDVTIILDPTPIQHKILNEVKTPHLVGFFVNGEELASKAAALLLSRGNMRLLSWEQGEWFVQP